MDISPHQNVLRQIALQPIATELIGMSGLGSIE